MSLKWMRVGASGGGGGDVNGPGSATLMAIPRWANVAGTLLADSGIIVDANNNISIDAAAAGIALNIDPAATNNGFTINALDNGTGRSETTFAPEGVQSRVGPDGADWAGYDLTLDQGMRIFDDPALVGAFYHADYSAQGIIVKGDRWIPDKGYLDVAVNAPTFFTLTGISSTATILSADILVADSVYIIKDATDGAAPGAPQTIETEGAEEIDGSTDDVLIEDPLGVVRLYSDGTDLWSF